VLGRRRGRNRSSPQESTEFTADTDGEPDGAEANGENAPPPSTSVQGDSERVEPVRLPEPPAPPAQPPTRFRQTISDIATAHAELDNVLPPVGSAPPSPSIANAATDSEVVAPLFDQDESPAAPDSSSAPVATADAATPPPPPPSAPPPVEIETPPEPVVTASVPHDEEPVAVVAPETETVDSEPAVQAQAAAGNQLPRVMAVANQKGGVGKTTTSVNLGAALAEIGFRVLVIDLDPQGNATTGLGIDARNFEISMYDVLMRDASLEDCVEPTSMKNLFVAPATIALAGAEIELVPAFSRELKLRKSIESVIDDFDYVLIDCPPSLGLITVNALAAASEVLVPIQCEYYALEGLSQLMRNVHLVASNLNPNLDISTIVLTMYDARTKLSDQVANEVRLHFGTKVCRNVIPRTVRLSEAPSFGQPITAFDPASRGAIAYRELAKEVSGGTS
jgi:chromosome partitioning protein